MRLKFSTCMIVLTIAATVLWHINSLQLVYASEISVDLSVDRSLAVVGESVNLTISVTGVQSLATPTLPELDGFEVVSTSKGTSISIVNGKMTSSANFEYRLRALKEGLHEIGPFSLKIQNKEYRTNKVTIEVSNSPQASSERSDTNLDGSLFVTVEPARDDVYLGEVIPVKVKLYARDTRINQISYPMLTANGFSIGSFEEPLQYEEVMNTRLHNVVEFTTYVVPASQGVLKLGPAQIKAEVLVRQQRRSFFGDPFFDDFFSDYSTSSVNLVSNESQINVKALPVEGRPKTFNGAVGKFSLSVEATPASVTVGDPIVLTMKVSGNGNFKAVSSPGLQSTEGLKVYDSQVKESSSTVGIKVFEQVVIPTSDNVTKLPEVLFSYFDPTEGVYKTLTAESIPIHVIPGPGETATLIEKSRITSDAETVMGEDILYIKDSPGRVAVKGSNLHSEPWFWALNVIPVMGLAGISLYSRRKTRLETDIAYARSYRAGKVVSKGMRNARIAMEKGDTVKFYDILHRTIQQYLGDKFNLPPQGISADVVENLKYRGLPDETFDFIAVFFEECDMIRFAPLNIDQSRMSKVLDLAEQLIENIEMLRSRGGWI